MTLKLEAGKYYRLRNGDVVGPLTGPNERGLCGAPGYSEFEWYSEASPLAVTAGRRDSVRETHLDIVAEVPAPPEASVGMKIPMFKGSESDLKPAEFDFETIVENEVFVAGFLNALATKIHADNVKVGWWTDLDSGESVLRTRNVPEMLMLIVSEISEAMEGHRKNLMDDKLPMRPMMQTELADAMIRILDLAGSRMAIDPNHPIGDIMQEKRLFNAGRSDHKIENRIKKGGKRF